MPELTALTNCGAVLTNVGPVVQHATVLFLDAGVVAVTTDPPPDGAVAIDVRGRVVTPGLVDAHTHAVFVGSRADEMEKRAKGATYQDIAKAGGGIMSTVRAVRAASDEDLYRESKWHAEMMLRCGTTTAEVKSGYGLSTEHEVRMLCAAHRLQAETPLDVTPTFLALHAVPTDMSKQEFVEQAINETLLAAAPLADAADVFVEEGYFDAQDARRLARACKQRGLTFRMHADQFSEGGAELAAELGARTADHLEQTKEAGIKKLHEAGVVPVLLPASVHLLGLRWYPDARRMLDLGMPVVLATDFNPGSSPTPSLPFAMSLACTQMGMTPMEALTATTLHPADALGMQNIGRLGPGSLADMVVWDTDDLREVPYFVAAPMVWAVFKRGVRVV